MPPTQLIALESLLESMVNPLARASANAPADDEEITAEEAESIRLSREWFWHNEGTPFEEVVSELGFTLDDIRNNKEPA